MDIRCWRCAKPITNPHYVRNEHHRPVPICDPCHRFVSILRHDIASTLGLQFEHSELLGHAPWPSDPQPLQDLPAHLL